MATATIGSLVGFFSSVDTDAGPLIGRLTVVATDANVIQTQAAAGDVQGDSSSLGITVSDAELATNWWTVDANPADPPGSIGTLECHCACSWPACPCSR